MRLIICNSLPTSRIFGEKFDAWWYARQGLEVEFWDLAPLFLEQKAIDAFYAGAPDYRYMGPAHRSFSDFDELQAALRSHTEWLFWHVSRFERMHDDDRLIRFFNQSGVRYLFQHFDPPAANPASPLRCGLRALKAKWHRRDCHPVAVVTSGTVGRSHVKSRYPRAQVISIPSVKVLWTESSTSAVNERPYALFVDESLAYDPDAKMSGLTLFDDVPGYYRRMRELFSRVEDSLGCEVRIGCSGKYLYPDPESFFGPRQVIYSQTLPLMQRCKLAMGHVSLALDQAIVSKKPVLLLDDQTFTSYRRRGFRDAIARFRQKPVINEAVDGPALRMAMERDLGFYADVEHDWLRERDVTGDARALCLAAFKQLLR